MSSGEKTETFNGSTKGFNIMHSKLGLNQRLNPDLKTTQPY